MCFDVYLFSPEWSLSVWTSKRGGRSLCSFEPPRTKHRVINLLLSTARPCSKAFVRPPDAKLAEPSPSMQMFRPQRSECSISHINSHFFSQIHRRPSQVLLKGFSRSSNYASGKKEAEKNVCKQKNVRKQISIHGAAAFVVLRHRLLNVACSSVRPRSSHTYLTY